MVKKYTKKPYTPPANRVSFDLDFHTLDRLTALAKSRDMDKNRCAYELLQLSLGIEPPPPAPAPDDTEKRQAAYDRGLREWAQNTAGRNHTPTKGNP